ncbi:hypothetical protein OG394_09565 [Kribbella sp. NBC_01245]|uniref:hypothetical protein n=1 Tax=Kribbella sp. NBC_01245 TaxID=2903578 RepID=UPI002E293C61|nr:hypothetical protein [Kribbella sp. NBC_01245]
MVHMGEASPDAWSDELRRTGQVVFTLRPRAALLSVALLWLVLVATQLPTLGGSLEAGGVRLVTVWLLVATAIAVTGWYVWRLITRYPMFTVDHQGIRVGRKRFLPWSEVGASGLIRGGFAQQVLPIVPKDPWAKDLTVDRMAVKNIPALAHWLEEVLKAQRTPDHD